jgi:SAM-dependent methyltransferase
MPYPKFDLHTISNYYQNEFDFFIFNQTLEHLYNPFEAVKQIYEIVKPGGYVFTSVPTINIPHMTPFHFNGFTSMGLAMLFKTANFEIIEIGQWGNYNYIKKLWESHNWIGYNTLNVNNKIVNEERNACQCWILAKKM